MMKCWLFSLVRMPIFLPHGMIMKMFLPGITLQCMFTAGYALLKENCLIEQLGKMVDKYEAGLKNPVSLNTMSKEYLEQEIKGLIGFEIEITEIQAASKLSQNRDEKNYDRILAGLAQKGDQGFPDNG